MMLYDVYDADNFFTMTAPLHTIERVYKLEFRESRQITAAAFDSVIRIKRPYGDRFTIVARPDLARNNEESPTHSIADFRASEWVSE